MKFKIFLALFVSVSVYATVTKRNLYPINAYRMFSKNWLGQTITGIEAFDGEGRRVLLWKNAKVPFFQVNNVAFQVFGKGMDADKAAFCAWVRAQIGSDVLSLHQVDRKYARVSGEIDDTPVLNRRIYQCSAEKI